MATLALGIAAATSLFSVVHGVLLAPLPWPDADRLVRLTESREGGSPRRPWIFTSHAYQSWLDDPQTVDGLAAWRPWTATLTGAGEPLRLPYVRATASLFTLLRARPVAGRFFTGDEERSGGVVVISEGLWAERFGRSPDAIGRVLQLDGEAYRVVGVAPRGFAFPGPETRAWLPQEVPPAVEGGNAVIFSAMARLRPGFTPAQAAAEGTARAERAPSIGPIETGMFGAVGPPRLSATPLLESLTSEVRPALLLLLAAVGLLLLAAVANAAGLQLAAATARRRELAVRSALGAGRGRLARQLLLENLWRGVAGGALGLVLAAAAVRVLPSLLPADFPRLEAVALDLRAAAFAVALSLATGVGVGLLPALTAGRLRLTAVLAEDGAASLGVGRSGTARVRGAILVGQVAVACVLLLGGVQLARSFFAQLATDRGYRAAGVVVAELTLPEGLYTAERRWAVVSALLERLRGLPDVEGAAVTNLHPLSEVDTFGVFPVRSRGGASEGEVIQASIRAVSPGYFEVLGRPLLAGRPLREGDSTAAPPPLVVSRTFAERFLDTPAVGAPVGSYGDRPDFEVVGVVEDVRPARLSDPVQPEVLGPLHTSEGLGLQWLSLLVRTRLEPAALAPTLRALLREQDPVLVPDRVRPLEAMLVDRLAQPRLYSTLVSAFAACALAIVGVGLFGLLSYTVALRRREIGLRVALGARPGDVMRLVGRSALAHTGLGLGLGLATALAGERLLAGLLWGVEAHDLPGLAAAVGGVAAVSALAALLPARRAAAIDPQRALRGS